MQKPSFWDKLKYNFDNIMAKGTIALIGWLAILSILLILIVSLFVLITNAAPGTSFLELLWMSLLRTLDPGTMGGDQGSFLFLLAMLVITLGGIFIISMLIGLITTGIENKIETLRKGRSRVLEENHTVILGWSERVFTIISELVIANSNQKNPCIVIMGDKDKVEMEDEIRTRIGSTDNTKVVCRQGNPVDLNDLEIVNLDTCKSVIIVEESDSNVIKTILAIINNPNRREKPYHIVASIKDPRNYEVAKMVGRDEVEIILVDNLISRIVAQTCLQPGLSVVYTELMDYDGDEIYFCNHKELAGLQFKDVLLRFKDSAVIGVFSNGVSKLNPPMDTVIQEDDEIIAITKDDDTMIPSEYKGSNIVKKVITTTDVNTKKPEHTLILGWNERAATIITEMDHYVAAGSSVTVVADYKEGKEELAKDLETVTNLQVKYLHADTADRRVLDELLTAKSYDHIIILCYSHIDEQEADAITLITLLHLRDISEKSGLQLSIVSEMRDIRNRNLAEIAKVNDFIVSDKLISLLITQISENKHLNMVFADLFDADGSEIYIKPAANYVELNTATDFYQIVTSASQRNEVAIGYKIAKEVNKPGNYGIYINPVKSDQIILEENDSVIVLAED
ncbi:MAG TPA: potassium transporter TrkA [Bacillota bacterium]|jgi:voltage-gated potassium channel Kch|nr:potassium transporter TrkA [Bacillota bacterium]HOL10155.1 potassium transporter TrkA [Bacillota bacterium]HPO97910.1 potassium transporter TrkA [Bacillota bacterium]